VSLTLCSLLFIFYTYVYDNMYLITAPSPPFLDDNAGLVTIDCAPTEPVRRGTRDKKPIQLLKFVGVRFPPI
jgi:hypothetical protein